MLAETGLEPQFSWLKGRWESAVGEANGFGVLATNTSFSVDPRGHLNSLYEVLHVVFRAIQHSKKGLFPASAPVAPITHTLKSAE